MFIKYRLNYLRYSRAVCLIDCFIPILKNNIYETDIFKNKNICVTSKYEYMIDEILLEFENFMNVIYFEKEFYIKDIKSRYDYFGVVIDNFGSEKRFIIEYDGLQHVNGMYNDDMNIVNKRDNNKTKYIIDKLTDHSFLRIDHTFIESYDLRNVLKVFVHSIANNKNIIFMRTTRYLFKIK
jgi:hypothetical protein